MSWYDALEAFAGGFRHGMLGGLRLGGLPGANGHAAPSAEGLCADNGWDIDERRGSTLVLHFRGPRGRLKKLYLVPCDGPALLMYARSDACIPYAALPVEIFAYLARRNGELGFAAWHAHGVGDGGVGFMVSYTALAHGLNPPLFKELVQRLVAEAADLDGKLEQAGLLGS